jgi:hypothetical protein
MKGNSSLVFFDYVIEAFDQKVAELISNTNKSVSVNVARTSTLNLLYLFKRQMRFFANSICGETP